MRIPRFILVVNAALALVLVASPSRVSAQLLQSPAAGREGLDATWSVSCLDANGALIGPRSVRGPILVSKAGDHAFVEVDSLVLKDEDTAFPNCRNTTRVYVRSKTSPSAELILFLPPMKYVLGNGVELADWSPDGRYLLMTEARWTYYSDSFGFHVYLYDFEQKILISMEHKTMFDRRLIRDTNIAVRAISFHTDGISPVVIAVDMDVVEASSEVSSSEPDLWVMKWQQNVLERLPSDYKVKWSGKILENKKPDATRKP